MPVLDKIRTDYESKGVRFLYVGQTMRPPPITQDDCTKMLQEIGVKGDLAVDPANSIGEKFQVHGYPTMVILDKSGKVAAVNIGASANLTDKVKGQLDALLAGKPIPAALLPQANAPAARGSELRATETLVGLSTPAFKATTESDKPIANNDLGGASVAVLDFFSPRCSFCRKQMPIVDEIRAAYESKGARFIYVSQKMRTPQDPTKDECTKMMQEIGIKGGELAMDPGNKIGELFKVDGYPTMVILDKSGKVAAVSIGARPDLAERMKGQLDALLAGKPIPAALLPAKPPATQPSAQQAAAPGRG